LFLSFTGFENFEEAVIEGLVLTYFVIPLERRLGRQTVSKLIDNVSKKKTATMMIWHTLTTASAIAPGVMLVMPTNAALLARVAREASALSTELGDVYMCLTV